LILGKRLPRALKELFDSTTGLFESEDD
jgi:hypothetical protein